LARVVTIFFWPISQAKQLTNWIRLGARNLGCPLKADTWRNEAPARREADSRWVLQVVNKDGEQSCLSSLPPPACFIQIFGHSRCALQGLDSPASRDQINDRDN